MAIESLNAADLNSLAVLASSSDIANTPAAPNLARAVSAGEMNASSSAARKAGPAPRSGPPVGRAALLMGL